MNEKFNVKDIIKYTHYDVDTAMVILTNDVLNLHLRPMSIGDLKITTTPTHTTVKIDTVINEDILKTGGKFYTGHTEVTFEKLDVNVIYPGGFSIDDWMGVPSILKTLCDNTKVIIDPSEFELITTQDGTYIQIFPTSILWRGTLEIKVRDQPSVTTIDPADPVSIGDVVINDNLNGFSSI